MAGPNWKDAAIDELAGPYAGVIPQLASIAYSRDLGPAPESKMGLLTRLIEGLEVTGPGGTVGVSPRMEQVYEHLLNKEGTIRAQMGQVGRPQQGPNPFLSFKQGQTPLSIISQQRNVLTNAAAPPQQRRQPFMTSRPVPYTDEEGNVLGFWGEYQKMLAEKARRQGQEFAPVLYPVESAGPRPPAP